MKEIVLIRKIHSDIGPRGEDYDIPYLKIDSETLMKHGLKVGDKVKNNNNKIVRYPGDGVPERVGLNVCVPYPPSFY
jgi:hypothetical protein